MSDEFEVKYVEDKRPLKFRKFRVNERTEPVWDLVQEHVTNTVYAPTLKKMEPAEMYKLLEMTAIRFCKAYSPTRDFGISKPEIRIAILYAFENIRNIREE